MEKIACQNQVNMDKTTLNIKICNNFSDKNILLKCNYSEKTTRHNEKFILRDTFDCYKSVTKVNKATFSRVFVWKLLIGELKQENSKAEVPQLL